MRRSVVRLIALREFRDLTRDRRAVLLILALPIILYPVFGLAGIVLAKSILDQTTTVGVVGAEFLTQPPVFGQEPFPELLTPAGAFADGKPPAAERTEADLGNLVVTRLAGDPDEALRAKTVDAVLVIPPDFADYAKPPAAGTGKPTVKILEREGDPKSKVAGKRLAGVVARWEAKLRGVRFARAGLPKDFDVVFRVEDAQAAKPPEKREADALRDAFSKAFPFILMMWILAGAMQPAVDLTAGEKERGTMETLLISPAGRTEIVFGKFFAVAVFAYLTMLWNVVWLTGMGLGVERLIGFPILNLPGLAGCVVLGFPLAMLFSSVCLAFGVFARSTKEGQYYLMPLFLIVMPLAFYGMLPGAELDAGTALIPVTGAILLQQKLLSVGGEPVPWAMFPLVLGALAAWVAVGLWLAVLQFNRESVLFRETGPEKGGGLLGRLFGKK